MSLWGSDSVFCQVSSQPECPSQCFPSAHRGRDARPSGSVCWSYHTAASVCSSGPVAFLCIHLLPFGCSYIRLDILFQGEVWVFEHTFTSLPLTFRVVVSVERRSSPYRPPVPFALSPVAYLADGLPALPARGLRNVRLYFGQVLTTLCLATLPCIPVLSPG